MGEVYPVKLDDLGADLEKMREATLKLYKKTLARMSRRDADAERPLRLLHRHDPAAPAQGGHVREGLAETTTSGRSTSGSSNYYYEITKRKFAHEVGPEQDLLRRGLPALLREGRSARLEVPLACSGVVLLHPELRSAQRHRVLRGAMSPTWRTTGRPQCRRSRKMAAASMASDRLAQRRRGAWATSPSGSGRRRRASVLPTDEAEPALVAFAADAYAGPPDRRRVGRAARALRDDQRPVPPNDRRRGSRSSRRSQGGERPLRPRLRREDHHEGREARRAARRIAGALGEHDPRFRRYAERFDAALDRVDAGQREYLRSPSRLGAQHLVRVPRGPAAHPRRRARSEPMSSVDHDHP